MKLQSLRHGEVLEQVNQQTLQLVPGQNQIPKKMGQKEKNLAFYSFYTLWLGITVRKQVCFLKEN